MNIRHLLLIAVVVPLAACAQGGDVAPAAAASAAAASASAAPPASVPDGDARIALAAKIPGAKPEDIRPTPVAGIYELTHGSEISYISADAKYVFSGDLYQVMQSGDFPNLSEVRRRELRVAALADVPEAEMIIYSPAKAAKHTITVFTDIDCPWCQRLHSQIGDYNALGIRVRYLFFPRSGPDTESWFKADAVWCAPDRKQALTQAKEGKAVQRRECGETPVARDFALGKDIGVTGTPGVVFDNGELVPGYLSPPQMLEHLNASKAGPPTAGNERQ